MTPGGKRVLTVVAVATNGVIGNGEEIPWHVPGELAEFKRLTMGHTLLMGRATFEAIGRPLPGRTTIVLTRDPAWSAEGVSVAHDLDSAVALADSLPGDLMVSGGGQIYAAALAAGDLVDEQVISEIPLEPEGTAHYPPVDESAWVVATREEFPGYVRVRWVRRDS